MNDQHFLGVLFLALFSLAFGMWLGNWLVPRPPLIGIGCENTSGPIYAFEEDYFPKCESIETPSHRWNAVVGNYRIETDLTYEQCWAKLRPIDVPVSYCERAKP